MVVMCFHLSKSIRINLRGPKSNNFQGEGMTLGPLGSMTIYERYNSPEMHTY